MSFIHLSVICLSTITGVFDFCFIHLYAKTGNTSSKQNSVFYQTPTHLNELNSSLH